jgi:hypothetical protein
MFTTILNWTSQIPTWLLGLLLLAGALVAAFAGHALRLRSDRRRTATGSGLATDNQEAYIVSGVLGLLALMLGFTLAMAVDRFDMRRSFVLQEANAIGTTYLRAQLLEEPHRARLSQLLVDYTDNRIALATAKRADAANLTGYRGQLAGAFLITLLTFALGLIIDLERPTTGVILESQALMELLRESLKNWPPEIFDRWRNVQSQVSPQRSP